MGKFLTTASSLALTAILTTGFAYAIEGAEPDAKDGLTIVTSTPAEGAAIAAIEKGELISMVPAQFAEYPEMYIEYEIQQDLGEGWEGYKSYFWMDRNEEEGNYSATFTRKFDFFEGTDYRVVYTAWESKELSQGPSRTANIMGVAYVNFTGTTARYECSPYTLTSISPEPSTSRVEGPILPNDCPYITVIFDGPVNLGGTEDTGILVGQGMGNNPFGGGLIPVVDGKEVQPDGETTIFAEEWHLTFGKNQLANMDSPLEITIKATDEKGRVVQGNMGKDAVSYSQYTYNVMGQYGKLQFNCGAAPIGYVSEIIVSEDGTSKGISPSWLKPASSIIITRNGEVVTTAKEVEQVYAPGQEDNPDATAVAARIILNETITEPGTYEVYIPGGYFNIGTQFDTLFQKEETGTFEVVAGPDYTAVPAAGVVTEIGSFAITYDVADNIAINPTAERVTLTAEDGTSIPVADFNAVGKTLTLALRGTITDPSTYTLCIPSGFVTVNDEAIPGIILEYTIEKQGGNDDLPATFDPAPGELTALPEFINTIWSDWKEVGSGNGIAKIQFNDEAPVNLPDLAIDWDNPNYNEITQPLGDFAGKTDEGTYTITFPAGYFNLGYNGDGNEEFSITYTIGGGAAPCPAEFTPAAGSIAALPEEVTVKFPDYSEAGGGYGKATIQFNAEDPVNLPDAYYHPIDWNAMNQPLGSFAGSTEKGTYTIHFPQGYFALGSGGNDESPAMDVVYEVNENTGVTNVTVKADRYVVFDLNGVQVLDTTDAETLKALKGIYIVNGIKIAF